MTKRKGLLQKISLGSSVISFVLAIASGVMLYLRTDGVSSANAISASWLSAILFFICVGGVLAFIGSVNVPSFKFDQSEE